MKKYAVLLMVLLAVLCVSITAMAGTVETQDKTLVGGFAKTSYTITRGNAIQLTGSVSSTSGYITRLTVSVANTDVSYTVSIPSTKKCTYAYLSNYTGLKIYTTFLPAGTYTVQLWAACGNVSGTLIGTTKLVVKAKSGDTMSGAFSNPYTVLSKGQNAYMNGWVKISSTTSYINRLTISIKGTNVSKTITFANSAKKTVINLADYKYSLALSTSGLATGKYVVLMYAGTGSKTGELVAVGKIEVKSAMTWSGGFYSSQYTVTKGNNANWTGYVSASGGYIGRVTVSCSALNLSKTVTFASTAKKTYVSLADYASSLRFATSGASAGTYTIQLWAGAENQPGVLIGTTKLVIQSSSTSTTTYRAYIVGMEYTDAGFPTTDYAPRNRGDAYGMKYLLGTLKDSYKISLGLSLTKSQILSGISTAFSGADSDDVSLFFFAGHGSSNGSLAAYDGSISTATLYNALNAIPGRVIVILGSCYSGQAISSGKQIEAFNDSIISAFSGTEIPDVWSENYTNSGEFRTSKFLVLTASAYNEVSFGGSSYNMMPYHFMYGAGWNMDRSSSCTAYADTNGDKTLTLNEAFTYTYNKVLAECPIYSEGVAYYQHVRVYPTSCGTALFHLK